jgi:predicted site-specific integrase-resolvase
MDKDERLKLAALLVAPTLTSNIFAAKDAASKVGSAIAVAYAAIESCETTIRNQEREKEANAFKIGKGAHAERKGR